MVHCNGYGMKNGRVESYPGLEACARLHENIKPKIFLYFYIITFTNTILVALNSIILLNCEKIV